MELVGPGPRLNRLTQNQMLPPRASTTPQPCSFQRNDMQGVKTSTVATPSFQLASSKARLELRGRPHSVACQASSRQTSTETVLACATEDAPTLDPPSTSGREMGQPSWRPTLTATNSSSTDSSTQQPMLQLVAAWDTLSAVLPPGAGSGADADVLVGALKLVLASASADAASRALSLASRLAEAARAGVPLDAGAIAAGIVREAFPGGHPGGNGVVAQRLGLSVAALLADLEKAARLPTRVDLYDDDAAAALRELCLAFYDVRATAIEVVSRLHALKCAAVDLSATETSSSSSSSSSSSNVSADVQVAALEALQIYAPLGHALGLGTVATELEELSLRLLFPASYSSTTAWLDNRLEAAIATLESCAAALKQAVESRPDFQKLAGSVDVVGRTKSPHSTLKKILRLGDTARGGRDRADIHDVIALRAVVQPLHGDDGGSSLSQEQAEVLAAEACYVVQQAAHELWKPLDGRTKDYIAKPKANGYQSLHSTVQLSSGDGADNVDNVLATMELQVRTAGMHDRAERGEAAHAAYKGGLDSAQARQLQQWTNDLLSRSQASAAATATALPSSPSTASPSSRGGYEEVVTMPLSPSSATEALFRSLDLNGDGRVSLEELRAAAAELAGGDAEAEALLAAADTDADGTVSLEEFLEFQRKVGQAAAAAAMDRATAGLLLSAATSSSSTSSDAATAVPSIVMVSNSSASTSMHSWNNNIITNRHRLNRRNATTTIIPAAFIERDGGDGGSLDEPMLGSTNINGASSSSSSLSSSSSYSTSGYGSVVATTTLDPQEDQMQGDFPSSPSFAGTSNGTVNGYSNGSHANGNGSSKLNDTSSTNTGGNSTASSSSSSYSGAESQPPTSPQPSPPPSPSTTSSSALELQGKPNREQGWEVRRAVHGFMRFFSRASVDAVEATWELIPLPTSTDDTTAAAADGAGATNLNVADAAGQTLPSPVVLPRHGPCVLGAVRDRDCDLVLDVPTVSGRHARFEVIRLRPADKAPTSKLVLMDLGSTNGTFVNRAKIVPFKEVPLYPGDVVCFAETKLAFEVRAVGGTGNSNSTTSSTSPSSSSTTNELIGVPEEQEYEVISGPAVSAALRIAASLEAEAAASGVFAPVNVAGGADVSDRARDLATSGEYQAAYMLLLGGAMSRPEEPALWAQLAAMERQRARRRVQGSSVATARAFLRAAVERFEAEVDAAVRRQGLSRVFSTWAQLEYDVRNDGPARILFQKAVRSARNHPAGPVAMGAAKLLFTWASREWKLGDAPLAARLCRDALSVEPSNPYALTLLGNIAVASGDVATWRELFAQATAADKKYVTALQSWARAEASEGNMKTARVLFRRALQLEPSNKFVLQAWAVAEKRAGRTSDARKLLKKCTECDPGCRAAWHAWGKLEEESGDFGKARQLYGNVLQLKPRSVETLSALGRLERTVGNLDAAESALQLALDSDPKHAPSLQELAAVKRDLLAQQQQQQQQQKSSAAAAVVFGVSSPTSSAAAAAAAEAEAYRLEKRARRVNAERQSMLAQVRRDGKQSSSSSTSSSS